MLDHLFSPLRLGPVELQNRIVSTAHQTTLVRDHLPTDDFVAYHGARARGGAGLIVLEATAVDQSGVLTGHTLAGFREEIVPGLVQVAAAVQPHGTRLFLQLLHGGRERIASPPRPPALAPSAVPSLRFHVEPRELSPDEIAGIVEGYGRAAAPALTLGVRLSADSEAARAMAAQIARHVDYIGLALGDSSTYVGSTGIVPPPPLPENAIAALTAPFQVGPPLLATSRIVDPVEADRLIGEGRCDAVGMTRALITDPDMPRKAQAGKSDAVVRCIGCNACIAHYHAGTPIACAQNPRTGRERTLPPPEPSADPRRIVVVGAGPAGLAAAAEAAAAGHDVVLLERSRRIGGQVALAGAAPMHEEVARSLRANYERLLD